MGATELRSIIPWAVGQFPPDLLSDLQSQLAKGDWGEVEIGLDPDGEWFDPSSLGVRPVHRFTVTAHDLAGETSIEVDHRYDCNHGPDTLATIARMVALYLWAVEMSRDNEGLHVDRDQVWRFALDAVASGVGNPSRVAAEAMRTESVQVERWYA